MKLKLAILILGLVISLSAWPDASIPTKDIEGAADPDEIGRFEGSFIVDHSHVDYDEISLPLAPLESTGKRGSINNWVYVPGKTLDLEGSRTRLVYILPQGISSLQVLRNYQKRVEQSGGKTLFECKSDECGGASNRSSGGGGGSQSLAMILWPAERVTASSFSTASCAQMTGIKDQRYAAMELGSGAGYLSVLAYNMKSGTYCGALTDITVTVVDVMARQEMVQSMVVIEPEEMAESIRDTGSIALYGIYFDTGKADLKPESGATLDSIAALLSNEPALKLLVVGHTDNQGDFEVNRVLSEQRAASVIDALVADRGVETGRLRPVGVAFAAPVASNKSEEGLALNRRVELVEQ